MTTTALKLSLGALADVVLPHLQGPLVPIARGRTALSRAKDADLGGFDLALPLLPFQRAGVQFATEIRRAMIGYAMGLGKTPTGIASIVKEQAFPALVVCPPNLALNWRDEFVKFAPQVRTHVITGMKLYDLPEADVYIIGDAIIGERKQTKKLAAFPGWGKVFADQVDLKALVIDESHRMKNRKAARTIAAARISRWIDPAGLVILLSGTPMKSHPLELLEQFEIMGVVDQVWGNKFAFMDTFAPKVDEWGTREPDNLGQLHAEMSDTVVARLTFPEVIDQLGDRAPKGRMRVPVSTPLAGPAATQYEAKVQELRDLRVQSRKEPGSVPRGAILKVYGELRHLIGLAKLDASIEHIADLVEQGDQVLVFAHHRDVVDALAKKFKAPKIQGGMKAEAIQEAKATFQAGDAQVLVLNLQAGGVGHNLTAAKHVVFVELGQTPDEMTQAEARADRLGQTDLVLCHWMKGANGVDTYDDRVILTLNAKQQVVSAVLDGDAEVLMDEGTAAMSLEEALDAWQLGGE